MSWTKQEEELAKKEYLLMIGTLSKNEAFKHDWTCNWDDFEKTSFGKKSQIIKGDKNKYMRYWLENQKIINDLNWNKIEEEDEWENY